MGDMVNFDVPNSCETTCSQIPNTQTGGKWVWSGTFIFWKDGLRVLPLVDFLVLGGDPEYK